MRARNAQKMHKKSTKAASETWRPSSRKPNRNLADRKKLKMTENARPMGSLVSLRPKLTYSRLTSIQRTLSSQRSAMPSNRIFPLFIDLYVLYYNIVLIYFTKLDY